MLNGIYTANDAVYGDLYVADGHVPETAMCNDWGRVAVQGDDWHVPEAAMYHRPATCN